MKPKFTAVGRYFVVYVNGERFSQHNAEREASESASGVKLENPSANVIYKHEYEVEVDLVPLEVAQVEVFNVEVGAIQL